MQGSEHSGGEHSSWTEARAEARLRSLELFGMRFGLDRMRRMMTALGSPERRFDTIQVLGTNGKSSTTRMLAAILERHGLRTGAYLSPHLVSYRERVEVRERPMAGEQFAAAIARASAAAERVNRTLGEGDHVTQFELLTAAALWHMAERDVQVGAIEAGLGGRYDATSVIDARVTALTNVALEHTRWLGPTIADIAEEKLAALAPGATLVLADGLAAPALAVAERVARERDARIVWAPAQPGVGALRAAGSFQRRNFALARTAAEAYLSGAGVRLREQAVRDAAASIEVPGRLQVVERDPLTILDGAHNPAAVEALVEALGDALGGRPLALVLGVLEDKDAARMLGALLPACAVVWLTAPPSARALPPATLVSLARQLGRDASTCEPNAARALEQAQHWARLHAGAVLATGSVYLVGELLGTLDAAAEHSAASARRRAGAGSSGARG